MDDYLLEYGAHSYRSSAERRDTPEGLKQELADLTRRFERLTIEGPGFSGSGEGISWDPTSANLGGGGARGEEVPNVTYITVDPSGPTVTMYEGATFLVTDPGTPA